MRQTRHNVTFFARHPALAALCLGPLLAGGLWYLTGMSDVLHISLAVMSGCALVMVALAEVRLAEGHGLTVWVARVLWDSAWFASVIGVFLTRGAPAWICLFGGVVYGIAMSLFLDWRKTGDSTPVPLWTVLQPTLAIVVGSVLALMGGRAELVVWVVLLLLCLPQERALQWRAMSVQQWLWGSVMTVAAVTAAWALLTGS